MAKAPSGRCVQSNPTSQRQYVSFGGSYINLSEIARSINRHHSYVSMILSGKRQPGLRVARDIAEALEIGVDDLVAAIDDRKATLSQTANSSV